MSETPDTDKRREEILREYGGIGGGAFAALYWYAQSEERELSTLRAKLAAAEKDAERWHYWRNYWPALCRFEVARFARIDLTRVHVDSPALMDQVTDAAIEKEKARERN